MKKVLSFLVITTLLAIAPLAQGPTKDDTPDPKKADDPAAVELPLGFKTDGCSMFPDGNYRDCCVAHDVDYYKGGKGRRASDKRLYRCVKSKKGWQNKFIAPLMYIGVRVGGVSFLPTPFRWGFGRKRMRRLKKKAELEKKKAIDKNASDKKDIKDEKKKSGN